MLRLTIDIFNKWNTIICFNIINGIRGDYLVHVYHRMLFILKYNLLTYSGYTIFIYPRFLIKILLLIHGYQPISKGKIILKLMNSLLNRLKEREIVSNK